MSAQESSRAARRPFAAAYTASKIGLRGFTASLRQELAPYPDIGTGDQRRPPPRAVEGRPGPAH